MQVVLRFLGQRTELALWERTPLSPGVTDGPRAGDRRDCYERVVATEPAGPPTADGPYRRLAEAIRRYQIFPPWLVRGELRRPVEVGDTFGVRYQLLPGVELCFAGRVTATFDGPEGDGWRAGWTFLTVQGHPEVGEETFHVEKDAAGQVRVGLRSWSRPGTWSTWLGSWYTRRVQVRASVAALDHLEEVARGKRVATALETAA